MYLNEVTRLNEELKNSNRRLSELQNEMNHKDEYFNMRLKDLSQKNDEKNITNISLTERVETLNKEVFDLVKLNILNLAY